MIIEPFMDLNNRNNKALGKANTCYIKYKCIKSFSSQKNFRIKQMLNQMYYTLHTYHKFI